MIEFKEFDESLNSKSGFDITPMLDMIFILLIFFLLTASAAKQVVAVELPEVEISEASEEQEVIISIDEHSIFLNGEGIAFETLQAELQEIYGNRASGEIFIESDKAVDFGRVVEIMDICRLSGADDISFIVDKIPAD